MRFADLSNLQPALTQDRIDAMWNAGIRGVVVGLQYPGPSYPPGNAHQNLAALDLDGRFVVTAYLENTPLQTVMQYVPRERLQRMPWIAVAVEENSGFEDEPSIRSQLTSIDLLGGPEAWLYSSPYEWQVLGLTAQFTGRKGWCADYDGNPDTPAPAFGGCAVAGKQYTGSGSIDGLGFPVDLSEIEMPPWNPSQGIPPGFTQQGGDDVATHIPSQSEVIWFDLALNHVMEAQQQQGGRKVEVEDNPPPGQRIYRITLNEQDGVTA